MAFGRAGVSKVSGDRILSSSASSVAVGFGRRTITILIAALVGLAAFLFLGVSTAYAATIEVKVGSLTDHGCDSTEWHFIINQIDEEANAPTSITVKWANGQTEVVPLDKFTGGAAHYATDSNLDSTVVSATAEIYDGWSGQFVLSHGPCGAPSPSPTPTDTPKPTETPKPSPTVETPKPSPTVETPAPVPTEVPAGTDASSGGGSALGLVGLALVASGAVAGTAVVARRRFLHDS
jgi:hypothetical protein